MSVRVDVTIPSGGETLAAYVYRPDDVSGDVPCVVMAHGFSGTREDGLPAYAEAFADAGFAAVLFDYRHFGASSGQPRQLLDIGRQHEDYRAAVAYARGLDGVDPDRIALWGSSFSGGHVVQVASEDPRIAAVVAQCPFTDGIAALRLVPIRNQVLSTGHALVDAALGLAGREHLIPAVGAPGTLAAMTAPEAEPGFRAILGRGTGWANAFTPRVMLRLPLYRPGAKAQALAMPLLVAVCDGDQTTPPQTAITLAEHAPRGELRRYPYGHFAIYDDIVAREDQVAFLTRHLVSTPKAAAKA